MSPTADELRQWRSTLQAQLHETVLPWWPAHMQDSRGGWYGGVSNDGLLHDDLPRSAILAGRMLWSYAEAARRWPGEEWAPVAEHAWRWITGPLWDQQRGGVFWSVDAQGRPLDARKHSYAQAFVLYGAAAWYRCSQRPEALQLAQTLFDLLEDRAHDASVGGYREGCTRDWASDPSARLAPEEPLAARTMNTLLHLMEAFSELLEVWPDDRLRQRLDELLGLMLDQVWQPEHQAFALFFDNDWTPISEQRSPGHDIEASWLMVRAAERLGDPIRLAQTRHLTDTIARAVRRSALRPGVGLQDHGDAARHWWCQAEGMVGFWDAFQHSGQLLHADAAWQCWQAIESAHIDPQGGDWFKVLDARGAVPPQGLRAGPWECPYHHVRALCEMSDRLTAAIGD